MQNFWKIVHHFFSQKKRTCLKPVPTSTQRGVQYVLHYRNDVLYCNVFSSALYSLSHRNTRAMHAVYDVVILVDQDLYPPGCASASIGEMLWNSLCAHMIPAHAPTSQMQNSSETDAEFCVYGRISAHLLTHKMTPPIQIEIGEDHEVNVSPNQHWTAPAHRPIRLALCARVARRLECSLLERTVHGHGRRCRGDEVRV